MMRTALRSLLRPGKVCSFTGYRPGKLPFGTHENDPRCYEFKFRLREALTELIRAGYTRFLSGGAMGMDLIAAELVLDLRKEYPNITLEVVTPCDSQADRWPEAYRIRYARLRREADTLTATSHRYTPDCMMLRNRYLVDRADLILACYDGLPGGTESTLRYAKKCGVPIRIIAPNRLCA